MGRVVSILRFHLRALTALARTLVMLPARAVAAVDHALVSRAPGALAFPFQLLSLLLTRLFDRRAALAGTALIVLTILLLILP